MFTNLTTFETIALVIAVMFNAVVAGWFFGTYVYQKQKQDSVVPRIIAAISMAGLFIVAMQPVLGRASLGLWVTAWPIYFLGKVIREVLSELPSSCLERSRLTAADDRKDLISMRTIGAFCATVAAMLATFFGPLVHLNSSSVFSDPWLMALPMVCLVDLLLTIFAFMALIVVPAIFRFFSHVAECLADI